MEIFLIINILTHSENNLNGGLISRINAESAGWEHIQNMKSLQVIEYEG